MLTLILHLHAMDAGDMHNTIRHAQHDSSVDAFTTGLFDGAGEATQKAASKFSELTIVQKIKDSIIITLGDSVFEELTISKAQQQRQKRDEENAAFAALDPYTKGRVYGYGWSAFALNKLFHKTKIIRNIKSGQTILSTVDQIEDLGLFQHNTPCLTPKEAAQKNDNRWTEKEIMEHRQAIYKLLEEEGEKALGKDRAHLMAQLESCVHKDQAGVTLRAALAKLPPAQRAACTKAQETITARLNRVGLDKEREASAIMKEESTKLREVNARLERSAQAHARTNAATAQSNRASVKMTQAQYAQEAYKVAECGFALTSVMHNCGAPKQAVGLVTSFSGMCALPAAIAMGPAAVIGALGAVVSGVLGMWSNNEAPAMMSKAEMQQEFDNIRVGIVKATLYLEKHIDLRFAQLEEHIDLRFMQLDQKLSKQHQEVMQGLASIFLQQNRSHTEIKDMLQRQSQAFSEKLDAIDAEVRRIQEQQNRAMENSLRQEYGQLQEFHFLQTMLDRRLVNAVRIALNQKNLKEFERFMKELHQAIVAESVGSDSLTGRDVDLNSSDALVQSRIIEPFYKHAVMAHEAKQSSNSIVSGSPRLRCAMTEKIAAYNVDALLRYAGVALPEGFTVPNLILLKDRAFAFLQLFRVQMEANDNQLSPEAHRNLEDVIQFLEQTQDLLTTVDQERLFNRLKIKILTSLTQPIANIQEIMKDDKNIS